MLNVTNINVHDSCNFVYRFPFPVPAAFRQEPPSYAVLCTLQLPGPDEAEADVSDGCRGSRAGGYWIVAPEVPLIKIRFRTISALAAFFWLLSALGIFGWKKKAWLGFVEGVSRVDFTASCEDSSYQHYCICNVCFPITRTLATPSSTFDHLGNGTGRQPEFSSHRLWVFGGMDHVVCP
jgi:hypothetical protein